MRKAFTLPELMIVIAIIAIISGLALSAFSGAVELAREQRTRSIISKIDQLITERYEAYRTRAVPIRIPPRLGPVDSNGLPTPTSPVIGAQIRLYALRDLMRMELPERITDLSDGPAVLLQKGSPWNVTVSVGQPSSWKSYRRSAQRACGTNWANTWSDTHQGSECLYLILSNIQDGEKNALDYFLPEEIGDTDGDNMKEILDAWGRPIEFLRWAPGYTIENLALTTQVSAYTTTTDGTNTYRHCSQPDPFDPVKVDARWRISGTPSPACFALRPLLISAGRDKQYDFAFKAVDSSGNDFRYATAIPPNDPYFLPTTSGALPFGTPQDFDSDGISADNITNHYLAP